MDTEVPATHRQEWFRVYVPDGRERLRPEWRPMYRDRQGRHWIAPSPAEPWRAASAGEIARAEPHDPWGWNDPA